MTAQAEPPAVLNSDEAARTAPKIRSITDLIAATLSGLHRVEGHFVRLNATVCDDGCIDVDVTRVSFDGENVTMRVLLRATAPGPVPPAFLPEPRTTV